MGNEFIENLMKKAQEGAKKDHTELENQTKGISQAELADMDDHFLRMLEKTFNPKYGEGEER